MRRISYFPYFSLVRHAIVQGREGHRLQSINREVLAAKPHSPLWHPTVRTFLPLCTFATVSLYLPYEFLVWVESQTLLYLLSGTVPLTAWCSQPNLQVEPRIRRAILLPGHRVQSRGPSVWLVAERMTGGAVSLLGGHIGLDGFIIRSLLTIPIRNYFICWLISAQPLLFLRCKVWLAVWVLSLSLLSRECHFSLSVPHTEV